MINKKNSSFYLRYLAKITDTSPISYDEIPQMYRDYFSIPVLSQTLNISIKYPHVNWSKVENYFEKNKFSSFDSVAEGIANEFPKTIDKLYAAYFYTAHHLKYDIPRSLQKDKECISAETLFQIQKGICSDYCEFFVQLAKQSGITTDKLRIVKFTNASKGFGYSNFKPPKTPDFSHGCVFIEYNGQEFICDPTWGAGSVDDDRNFTFEYKRSNFLIPYAQGILVYYPKDKSISSFPYSFTYEQFTSTNNPNFERELSIESTPLQVIPVDNDQYEMYFSFVQPCAEISSELFFRKDEKWDKIKFEYAFFKCIEKDVPNHMYTLFPEKKRCRYKMDISFPKEGSWKLKVYADTIYLFEVYFNVSKKSDKILGIRGDGIEESGFIPVEPVEGLTKVDNGMALIRFAIKMKNSQLVTELLEIKKETMTPKPVKVVNGASRYVTLNLPFESSSADKKDRLVEDWVWIKFPKNGRWEVKIYFIKDEISSDFCYGVSYYFDVSGVSDRIKNPIYRIPCTRTFVPFTHNCESYFRVEPSSSTVIIHDNFKFHFTVFSDRKLEINFMPMDRPNGNYISLVLVHEKSTNIKNVKERKYSVSVPRYGYYECHFGGKKYIGFQRYVVMYEKLEKESYEEKNLMSCLKKKINNVNKYDDDIEESIKANVSEMLSSEKLKKRNKNDIVIDQTKDENKEEPPKIIKKTRKREESIATNDDDEANKIEIRKIDDSLIEKTQKSVKMDEKIELTTIHDENSKLQNKIKTLEQEKEMLNSLLKEKEDKENQMKTEIEEKIKKYEERESLLKMESEQKILELTLKLQKMEKILSKNPQLLIEAQNNEVNETPHDDKSEITSNSRRKRHSHTKDDQPK